MHGAITALDIGLDIPPLHSMMKTKQRRCWYALACKARFGNCGSLAADQACQEGPPATLLAKTFEMPIIPDVALQCT